MTSEIDYDLYVLSELKMRSVMHQRLIPITFSAMMAFCLSTDDAMADVYRCSDSFNVPLGFLSVEGAGYEWTKVNSAFEPVEASENGSGELEFSGAYFVPRSGPMASWGVTGAIGDGFLNINNENGALMGCRKN